MEIDKKELDRLYQRIEMYFERTEELRAVNAEQRDAVWGQVFVYRVEGTDDKVGIWNMRRATPPQMIDFPDKPTLHLHERFPDEDRPTEYPELGDIVIEDVRARAFFDKLMAASWREWQAADEPMREKHGSFGAWTDVGFSRVLEGEIPWQLTKVCERMRSQSGWDQYDFDGDPWVKVKGASVCIKTERGRYSARMEMDEAGVSSTYIYQGRPGDSTTQRMFTRFERTPTEGPGSSDRLPKRQDEVQDART